MIKGYLSANDLQIAYCIHNPTHSNTIFFIHGNSSSSAVWRNQVKCTLLASYRLITIDLPSHGNSAAIDAEGDFSLPAIAKIVGAAINQLINDQPYIICSVSLGTNMVAEMLADNFVPQGLLLAGPCIVGNNFGMEKMILQGADVTAVFAENLPEAAILEYALIISSSKDEKDVQFFLADYNSVKGKFRSSLYGTIAAGSYNDQVAILQKLNLPVCIVFGKEEMVVNSDYLNEAPLNLWNKTIYKIPGASHLVNIDAPEAFNELLAAFAKDLFTITSVA